MPTLKQNAAFMSEPTRLSTDPQGIAQAARLIAAGGLVAFPTETVYGLGADATNPDAVARIFEAKGRPHFNPLIVHVPDLDAARRLVDLPDLLLLAAEAFWPGPLTLVAPMRADAGIAALATAGLPTLAVRVPEPASAQALLRAARCPVAAPSANASGAISPTTADHVAASLGQRIDAILDGGPAPVGLESSILGLAGDAPVLLRPGGLPLEALAACIGQIETRTDPGAVTAPGQLASHYAPRAPLRLMAKTANPDEVYLAFGNLDPGTEGLDLSPARDLREAAAHLFDHLHRLDELAAGRTIAVAQIPATGLGRAINDRLQRAAAPRP